MSSKDQRTYIVYLPPQDYEIGEGLTHTPQHLTLIPPLLVDPSIMTNAAKAVAKNANHFLIKIVTEGLINPQFETEVYYVEPYEPINNIHIELLRELEKQGIDLSRANWIKHDFIPHIAMRKRLPVLTIGQEMMFDNIAVIRKDGNIKTIIDVEKIK